MERRYTSAQIRAYENTAAWHDRSAAFRAQHGPYCAACGKTRRLDAHHLRYNLRRPGREKDRDLAALCRQCHDAVHNYQHWTHCTIPEATYHVIGQQHGARRRDIRWTLTIWTATAAGIAATAIAAWEALRP